MYHGGVYGKDEVSVESASDEVILTVLDRTDKLVYAAMEPEHALVVAGALERAAQRALRNVAARRDMEAYDKDLAREVYGDS